MSHPLDRPVWNALTGSLSAHALGDGRAVRMAPDVGLFAAAADPGPDSVAALTRLCAHHPGAGLVERAGGPMAAVLPAGAVVAARAELLQMTAEAITPGGPDDLDAVPLDDGDAAEIVALAALTQPGPFFARTQALGGFIGVRREGRLVAMAGHRLRLDGFTEISAVCTHPDHRGRGLGAALTRRLARAILEAGETPFLHVRAAHEATVGLYAALGFRPRAAMAYTVLANEEDAA